MSGLKELALFDFDGTISSKDSTKIFYQSLYTNRLIFLFKNIFLCMPEFIAHKLGYKDYTFLKRKRLQIHVGKLSENNFKRHLFNFHHKLLPSIIKQSALERIDWHKVQGHEIWIVSASFDFLLSEWCEKLNIGLITNITFKDKDKYIFEGVDCNFDAKVYQINNKINLTNYKRIYAYGDSDGDKAMLALANEPYFNYFI